MKSHHWIVFFLAMSSAALAATDPPIAVTGLVSIPLHLTLADLGNFPATHVSATQVSGHGPVALDCTGASLAAILDKAALNVSKNRNANLAHSLLVTGDDGYAVSLSLGELDPDYGNAEPIIATNCNGKPLDNPRLVVPHDKHGGRAVQGVVSIEVK
jgi:DMSO/TMAO reductase YedYZ molybdopterin-dependent catalytic subunit